MLYVRRNRNAKSISHIRFRLRNVIIVVAKRILSSTRFRHRVASGAAVFALRLVMHHGRTHVADDRFPNPLTSTVVNNIFSVREADDTFFLPNSFVSYKNVDKLY